MGLAIQRGGLLRTLGWLVVAVALAARCSAGGGGGAADAAGDVAVTDGDAAVTDGDAAPLPDTPADGAQPGDGAGDAAAPGDGGDAPAGDRVEPGDGLPPDATRDAAPDLPVVVLPCTATEGDVLCVGADRRAITPPGYEKPNPAYLREANDESDPHRCFLTEQLPRCGELADNYTRDCGRDALCPNDPGYVAPDADGSEDDGRRDWFFDCGIDQRCPEDPGYTAPDADGSEGNGQFDGFWFAGFGNNRPMAGVLDDISVRSIVLQHGGRTVGLFVLDLMGFFYSDFELARQRFAEKYPQDRIDYIFMQSTHTHQAPDALGQWGPSDPLSGAPSGPGVVGWWLDWVIEQAVDSLHAAYEAQVRTHVTTGEALTGVVDLMIDLRSPTIFDDRVKTVQFMAEADGQVVATLVHWANHPEGLGSRNNFLSSDYVHPVRRFIEEGLPARGALPAVPGFGGVAIYLQGAAGGMMAPPSHTQFRDGTPTLHRGPENTEATGEKIAVKAFDAIANATPVTDFAAIEWAQRVYLLRIDNRLFQFASLAGLFPRRGFYTAEGEPHPGNFMRIPPYARTEQVVVRMGAALTFYTYPGEPFPELAVGGYDGAYVCGRSGAQDCGYRLLEADSDINPPDLASAPAGPYTEEVVPGRMKLLLSVSMDELGYIVPAYDYKLSPDAAYFEEAPGEHYEETNSAGPECAQTDVIVRELAAEAAAF